MLVSEGLVFVATLSFAIGRRIAIPDRYHPIGINDQVSLLFPDLKDADNSTVPVTDEDTIRNNVDKAFLKRVPQDLDVRETRDNITAIERNVWIGSDGSFMAIDITNLRLDTCKPVISHLQELAPGLHCTQKAGCSISHTIRVEYKYSTTTGFKMGASLTVGGGIGIVDVEMSVSYETSFEFQWSRAQSQSDEYTFKLEKDEYCTPSMMHLDLECEATGSTYLYDTYWVDRAEYLKLEYQYARGGGPYASGQYCTEVWVRDDAIKYEPMAKYWKPLLKHDLHRGYMYTRATSDLNDYKLDGPDVADFTDDEIAIRREWGDGDGMRTAHIFRCKKKPVSDKKMTVRVPVKGTSGTLLGFIGCVGGF